MLLSYGDMRLGHLNISSLTYMPEIMCSCILFTSCHWVYPTFLSVNTDKANLRVNQYCLLFALLLIERLINNTWFTCRLTLCILTDEKCMIKSNNKPQQDKTCHLISLNITCPLTMFPKSACIANIRWISPYRFSKWYVICSYISNKLVYVVERLTSIITHFFKLTSKKLQKSVRERRWKAYETNP
jgi:hypothetical protein